MAVVGLRVGPGFGRNGGSCVGLAVVGGVGVGLDVIGCSVVGWSVVGSGGLWHSWACRIWLRRKASKSVRLLVANISSCTYHMHFLNWNELTVGSEVGSTVDTRGLPKIDSVIG